MPFAPPVTTTRQPVASIAIDRLGLGSPRSIVDPEVIEQDGHLAGKPRVDGGRRPDRGPRDDAAPRKNLELDREERVATAGRDREERQVPIEEAACSGPVTGG